MNLLVVSTQLTDSIIDYLSSHTEYDEWDPNFQKEVEKELYKIIFKYFEKLDVKIP